MHHTTQQVRSSRPARAQALVPVILVVVILTTVAIAFTASSSRELKAASYFNADTVRFNAARGAVNYAMAALDQISSHAATYGIVPPGADTDSNGWMQIGDAWVKIDVVDTGAFVNINAATSATLQRMSVFGQNVPLADAIVDWRTPETTATTDGAKSDYYQGLTPPYNCKDAPFDTVEELLLVKGMTPTILFGNAAGNPISPEDSQNNVASGSNQSLSGTTRQTTARPGTGGTGGTGGAGGGGTGTGGTGGTGTGGTGGTGGAGTGTAATAGDTNWDDIYGTSTKPLSELLTTLSMERNIAADGTARININTATATDLQGLGISTNLANALIRARTPASTNGGGTGGGTGGNRPGGATGGGTGGSGAANRQTPAAGGGAGGSGRPGTGTGTGSGTGAGGSGRPGNGTGSGTGTGTGTGTGATTSTFKTIADLLTVPGFTQQVMQQIADFVSVDDLQYHPNLVNINTAPAEVLATIPGMDHTTLNAILDFRQGGQSFQTLGDFFALQGVTRQEFQNVIASICTKSSIYRIRVKVMIPGQQNVYAVTAMVQLTDNGPQILQWRETPRVPGWAYWLPSPVLPQPTVTSSNTSAGH